MKITPFALLILWILSLFAPLHLQGISDENHSISQGKRQINAQQYERAKATLQKAAANFKASNDVDNYLEVQIYLMLTYHHLGDYSAAIALGKEMQNAFSTELRNNAKLNILYHYSLGVNYIDTQSQNELGVSYMHRVFRMNEGNVIKEADFQAKISIQIARGHYYNMAYDSAIRYYQKAIENYVDQDKYSLQISKGYLGLANAHWGLKQLDQAAQYYDRSLELLYQATTMDSLAIGKALHSQGYIYLDAKDDLKALQTFKKAYVFLEDKLPSVHPSKVWLLGDIGRSLIYLESFDSALIYLQKALIANTFEFENLDYFSNPELSNVNDEFQQFMILKLKGQALHKKYLAYKQPQDLSLMKSTYKLGDAQIDAIRSSTSDPKDQTNLNYYATDFHNEAYLSFLAILTPAVNDEHSEFIHYFLEKSLISNVNFKFLEAAAQAEGLIPPSLLEAEQQLIATLSESKSKLLTFHGTQSDSLPIVQKQLLDIQEQIEDFKRELSEDYPSYHSAKYNTSPLTLVEAQHHLQTTHPQTAIISYFMDFGRVNASMITQDTAIFMSKILDFEIEDTLDQLRTSIVAIDDTGYLAPSHQLYEFLLDEFLSQLDDQIENLVLIPSASLQLLPFEVLQKNQTVPYLCEQYNISYHYSTSLFVEQSNGAQRKNSKGFVGFAPSFEASSSNIDTPDITSVEDVALGILPGAIREVSALANLTSGEAVLNNQATETLFKSKTNDAKIIHIATHAIINESDPETSYLQFASSSTEDNRLHFFEIYDLELEAELVTLSACNSGYGKIKKGEGVLSLSRAFAYTGVPSTTVSLWPASDKSTPALMHSFYQNLDEGYPKNVALNMARKAYLQTAKGKAKHPFYWGGFVLMGDISPLSQKDQSQWPFLPPIFITIMLLAAAIRKRKATNR